MKKNHLKRKLQLGRKTVLLLNERFYMGGVTSLQTAVCETEGCPPETFNCTRSTVPGYCNNTTQPPPPSTTKPICD